MPDESEAPFSDFTSDDYIPTRTPKGIPYDKFNSPQKAAGLLMKAARKANPRPGGRVSGKASGRSGRTAGKTSTATKK